MAPPTRYRFADFIVSRHQRLVLHLGRPVPLIPRYFDLLWLLIERRPAVVTRREIFDLVWADVIVSDGALSQAIRTLRRALGDDSRDPVFIRTVSRHGYSFVYGGVREEPDDALVTTSNPGPPGAGRDSLDALVTGLLDVPGSSEGAEEGRDLAERLHALSTAEAVERLSGRPGHAMALALLRDTRWNVPGAGPVPLWGQPEGLAAARLLIRLRAREAIRITRRRWAGAAAGAGVAGLLAGAVGGTLLVAAPTATTPLTAIPVLMALGALAGFTSAAGVAAGVTAGEAVARSRRGLAIVAGGAAGGLAIGVAAMALVGWTLRGVFGLDISGGGPLEGVVMGAALGSAYALTTPRRGGGIARPLGRHRLRVALTAGAACALAAVLISLSGRPLVGGRIHQIAEASRGSQVAFTPLAAWIGEPGLGPVTQTLIAGFEGALFGLGLAWGLTRR